MSFKKDQFYEDNKAAFGAVGTDWQLSTKDCGRCGNACLVMCTKGRFAYADTHGPVDLGDSGEPICATCGHVDGSNAIAHVIQYLNTAPVAAPAPTSPMAAGNWGTYRYMDEADWAREKVESTKQLCECGSHALGAADFSPLHSYWCAAHANNEGQ